MRSFVLAVAIVDVDVVDTRRRDLDEHLAGLRFGLGHLAEMQHVGTARAFDRYCLHAAPNSRRPKMVFRRSLGAGHVHERRLPG